MAEFFAVQELPEDDAAYRTTTFSDGVWGDYLIRWRYKIDPHVEQLATAAPAGNGRGKASIVKWADTTMQVRVEWFAERSGAWPIVPEPEIADDNLTLLDAQIIPESPPLEADGVSGNFKMSGVYLYAVTDPDKVVFQAGLMPWINESIGKQTAVPRKAFQHGLIDKVPGVAAGGAATGGNLFGD